MQTRRYVALVLMAVALVPVSTAAFNLAVDPYDFQGMLGLKPLPDAAPAGMRTAQGPFSAFWYGKAYNVRWFRPDAAVFGSSSAGSLIERHEIGRDPRHPFGRRVFDFSVGGPSVGMLKHLFMHTEALSRLDQAILELNFFMFNADRQKPADDTFDIAPMAHLPGYRRRFLQRMLELSVTQEQTRDSVDILLRRFFPGTNLDALENAWLASFQPSPSAPMAPAAAIRPPTADDYRQEMLALDRFIYIGLFHDHPHPAFRFADETGYDTFAELRAILDEAHRRGTRLRIYLSPSHARFDEMIDYDGRWLLYEEWKRRVTALVAADAAAHPGQGIPLWDFSGYNSVTMEPFPEEGGQRYENYLDTVHFSRTVADLIVDRMLDFHETGRVIPDDFGIRLTPDNVEQVIAATRDAKARYEAAHRDDIAALRAVLGTVQ